MREGTAAIVQEAEALGDYFASLGVQFKSLKSRRASTRQLVLGFWWDSVERTRSLEDSKYELYLDHLRSVVGARTLTLHELQVLAGRIHRASLTLPMRAKAYMANVLRLMRGLKMPWHRRRVTAAARRDVRSMIEILEHNHGKGVFAFDDYPFSPPIYTDASVSSRYAGGGYFTLDGAYDYWQYTRGMSRKPIMILEADSAYRALKARAASLRGTRVDLYTDNQSFGLALRKGASSNSLELNDVLKKIFRLTLEFDFVVDVYWIPTECNHLADALSRKKIQEFFWHAADFAFRDSFHLRRCHYID